MQFATTSALVLLAASLVSASPVKTPSDTTAQCGGRWETVTNDPVVQWWELDVPNVKVDHSSFWNHLNLNDCAPTANTVYTDNGNKGVFIKFHASEPCTHTAIEHAFRSASNPPTNIGCLGPGDKGGDDSAAEGVIGVLDGIFESLGGEE